MSEDKQKLSRGPFIPAELRPPVGSDLAQTPPLEPGVSQEEIRRRAGEAMDEAQRARLGLAGEMSPAEMWGMIFTRSPNVEWTVLDKEAVLLNLDNGVYYTLNRVGAAVWEIFRDDLPLAGILAAVCARFDVAEEVARGDLIALITRLYHEGLILQK